MVGLLEVFTVQTFHYLEVLLYIDYCLSPLLFCKSNLKFFNLFELSISHFYLFRYTPVPDSILAKAGLPTDSSLDPLQQVFFKFSFLSVKIFAYYYMPDIEFDVDSMESQ